ncbi:hypothetical protein [Paraflavitalea sp. CAU 1676]|uniref:hypothetical protein n=1 Tax=Paraflavitalea sp. CAU 1676 TaxID=3032598 RepID=UPI0023DB1201|nr:hypothetical protein [Paraflavitalea sp. CAU 1676]MDF2190098.1 hypothetical protein [Paraflavitalea sp. CAU 1676]
MLTQTSTGSNVQVLVFKTDLSTRKKVRQLALHLDQESGILRWNVDHWDADNVLRIETTRLSMQQVIDLVTGAGYHCTALPD